MARSKPKKVFYNRRYKMPAWGQPYALWAVTALAACIVVFFTSVERVSTESAPALPATLNGFAEGLFYDLRDAETGSLFDTSLAYAKRLEKKHGYKIRDEKISGCHTLRITRGAEPRYAIAATLDGEKSQNIFALLTFLDRIAPHNPSAAIEGSILFSERNCDKHAVLTTRTDASVSLPIILDTHETEHSYTRVFYLKNLKLRRHFESAFFMSERTLWADVLAMIAGGEIKDTLVLPVKSAWAATAEATLAQNPLLRHPLVAKADLSAKPVAIYLSENMQLTNNGFVVIAVVFWLLAFIPFANALGTFRERLDLGSALTSGVVYAIAFFLYFLLLKLVVHFAKSDFATLSVGLVLIPAIFIPLRVLQKNVLRAELNRPGLHALVQALLTVGLFLNPLLALWGLFTLLAVSAFSRAESARKILRIACIALLFALFYFSTRHPLGNFTNFLSALLPVFTASGTLMIILLSFICGNLIALFFVPRERV